MWTLKPVRLARSVGPQLRTWLGLLPLIEHSPAFDWLSIDQVTPAPEPAGRLSLTVTPLAVPVPVLVTLIVEPIGSPALTEAASAVFRMSMWAGRYVMTSPSESDPSSLLVAFPILS